MKRISRLVLSVGLLGLPWAIACAYGTLYKYSKAGRVVDRESHLAVPGIRVSCVVGGAVQSSSVSGPDGDVLLSYEEPCDTLAADDTDGDENGRYVGSSQPFSEASASFTVLVDRQK